MPSPEAGAGGEHPGFGQIRRRTSIIALALITLLAGGYFALKLAMHWIGPPPLSRVAHLMPTSAQAGVTSTGSIDEPHQALRPENVDPRYLAMLLAFEDRRYYSHFGVDPVGLARA